MHFVIVGGGLFGMYIARSLLNKNYKVTLIEQSNKLYNVASRVNQARLHLGFHYPRSPETVKLCKSGYQSFSNEFEETINSSFKQIYMISKDRSKTSFREFKDFCKKENLNNTEIVLSNRLVNNMNIEGSVLTSETSFDYSVLGNKILQDLIDLNCNILYEHKFVSGNLKKREVIVQNHQSEVIVGFDYLINCTYSNINKINNRLGIERLPLKFELCELIKVKVPLELRNYGFTIMDGDFMSIMPYGLSEYHTIWHVKHSVHLTSTDDLNNFNEIVDQKNLNSSIVTDLKDHQNLIESSYKSIINDSKKFLPWIENTQYIESVFVTKAILNNVEDTDSRPSLVVDYPSNPNYFVVFSGKIDTLKYTSDRLIEMIESRTSNE